MTELFDDVDDDKVLMTDDDLASVEDVMAEICQKPTIDARRRLEHLMDEKRLRDELEDFLES